MKEFKVGALVVAVSENQLRSPLHPNGNAVKPGHSGEIVGGPTPYSFRGDPMNYWRVQWADGRNTWSGQGFLVVIGDKGPCVGVETDVEALTPAH